MSFYLFSLCNNKPFANNKNLVDRFAKAHERAAYIPRWKAAQAAMAGLKGHQPPVFDLHVGHFLASVVARDTEREMNVSLSLRRPQSPRLHLLRSLFLGVHGFVRSAVNVPHSKVCGHQFEGGPCVGSFWEATEWAPSVEPAVPGGTGEERRDKKRRVKVQALDLALRHGTQMCRRCGVQTSQNLQVVTQSVKGRSLNRWGR